MDRNICPHCGKNVSTWKKWQLTDNRYGKRCPHCGSIIVLPKAFVRFVQIFNIIMAVILVIISYNIEGNRILVLISGAAVLIVLNILILRFPSIQKEKTGK